MPYYKRDDTATDALYANKVFADRRSYLSLPDTRGVVHTVLEGQDRSRQRHKLYEISKGKCAVCRRVSPENEDGLSRAPAGEMHHPGHCDCLSRKCPDRLEWRCSQFVSDCHRHRQAAFRRHAKTAEGL